MFIQKFYIHSITCQFVNTDMEGQSGDRMISAYKNRRKVVHVSCSVHDKNKEQAEMSWNHLEKGEIT